MNYAPIRSLLIANRSEIAIRVMRAAAEMDIRTVAIYSNEDRLALHRFKADESYLVGEGKKPLAAYLDIDDILRIARRRRSTRSIRATASSRRIRISRRRSSTPASAGSAPQPEVMRTLGNKVAARQRGDRGRRAGDAGHATPLPLDLARMQACWRPESAIR